MSIDDSVECSLDKPVQLVKEWAEKHKDVLAVVLGGSRAKGNGSSESDYDFSIKLSEAPTPDLVEHLCSDLSFAGAVPAEYFPQVNRHFGLVVKMYYPDGPEMSMGFVDIMEFYRTLKSGRNHSLVYEVYEFIKPSVPVYDPHNLISTIQSPDFRECAELGYVMRRMVRDSMLLTDWSLDKYQKVIKKVDAVRTRKEADHDADFLPSEDDLCVAGAMVKGRLLWNLSTIVAASNIEPLPSGYDFPRLRELAAKNHTFVIPKGFFEYMVFNSFHFDYSAMHDFASAVKEFGKQFLEKPLGDRLVYPEYIVHDTIFASLPLFYQPITHSSVSQP